MPDPSNAKEYHNYSLKRKNTKSVKQSKIIAQRSKIFKNPNIVDIKSIIIEHLKTSHEFFEGYKTV